jgi:hypothetical protein
MPCSRHRIAVTVAVVAASVTMVTTVNTHVAVAAVSGVLFADNFTGMAPGVPFAEGERRGQWIATYNGYGLTQVERDAEKGAVLSQAPQATSQEDVTHAAATTTARQFGNVDITVEQKTVEQTRTPEPNGWEVPWLLWNYTDDDHFYSLVLKPTGWELGKEDPAYPGAQRYLATGAWPAFNVGSWHTLRIRQVDNKITAWGDGQLLATVTDRERTYRKGHVGLYTEDAHVHHANIVVRSVS